MIVVDTNVWSETLYAAPERSVLMWLREHSRELYMPVTAVFELRFGVERLETGRRRQALSAQVERMLADLSTRILDYGVAEAAVHAKLRAEAMRAGRGLSAEDGQVLATAIANGGIVATRNARHFHGFGVDIIDPWKSSAG